MRPSFRIPLIFSLAAHLGIFALVGLLRATGRKGDAGAAIIAVKILVDEAETPSPAPPAPERVREVRRAWTPREATVPPSRVRNAPPQPARAPANAQPPARPFADAQGGPAAGPLPERPALRPAALVPGLAPSPPATMRLAGAPEPSVDEAVAAQPLAAQPPAEPPARAFADAQGGPAGGFHQPEARPGAKNGEASAEFITLPRPVYPRLSRIHAEEGTVVLSVEIGADGAVGRVSIVESSGYRRLDASAVQALRSAACRPATRGGRPVPSTKRVAVAFRLREPDDDEEE